MHSTIVVVKVNDMPPDSPYACFYRNQKKYFVTVGATASTVAPAGGEPGTSQGHSSLLRYVSWICQTEMPIGGSSCLHNMDKSDIR